MCRQQEIEQIHMIAAKTLDLNVDFRVIAAQLNSIAIDYFGRDRAAGE